jgi:hypothetical protein
MKISHLIPENSSYEGIFCSFQTLVVPFKPLVGRSSLHTLIQETWVHPGFFFLDTTNGQPSGWEFESPHAHFGFKVNGEL